MSKFVIAWNDYLCMLVVYGYARQQVGFYSLNDDISCICASFVYIPTRRTKFPRAINVSSEMEKFHHILGVKTEWTKHEKKYLRRKWKKVDKEVMNKQLIDTPKNINIKTNTKIETIRQRYRDNIVIKEITQSDNDHFHVAMSLIKDDQSLFVISQLVEWRFRHNPTKMNLNKYQWFDQCWDIIIDYGKKWMTLKCEYMKELIEMYQKYHWSKSIKMKAEKMSNMSLLCGIGEEWIIDKLNNVCTDCKRFKINEDGRTWNEYDQMKLSNLLQKIAIEYDGDDGNMDEMMDELDIILDFVSIKYEMLISQINHYNHIAL